MGRNRDAWQNALSAYTQANFRVSDAQGGSTEQELITAYVDQEQASRAVEDARQRYLDGPED